MAASDISASNAGVFDGIGGCSSPAWGLPFISTGNTRCSGNHTDSKPASSAACAAVVQNFVLTPASITPIFMARDRTGIVAILPVEVGGTDEHRPLLVGRQGRDRHRAGGEGSAGTQITRALC